MLSALPACHILAEDPRASGLGEGWRAALAPYAAVLGDSLVPDESPIAEAMNVAWAQHEFCATHIVETIAFWEEHAATHAAAALLHYEVGAPP